MTPDPIELWQGQASGSPPSVNDLQARIARLHRRTRVRTYSGLAACGIVFAGTIWWLTTVDDPLARTGAVMTAIGVLYMAAQAAAHRTGGRRAAGATDLGRTSSLDHHLGELARQRDFHSGRALWTRLLIFAPGPLVFAAGFSRARPEMAHSMWFQTALFVFLLMAAVPFNLRLARSFQRQIDELTCLGKERS